MSQRRHHADITRGSRPQPTDCAVALSRRAFLAAGGVAAAASSTPAVGLSFGSYALWMLTWGDALELIGRTGYDGVELALMPGWPTEPEQLSSTDRSYIRSRLGDMGLALPAVLEQLRVAHPTQTLHRNLERLRRAIDLGADLAPGKPPIVETTLGRSPGEWDAVKNQFVDEIGEWVRVAGDTVICFKPHVGNAVNNIERSLWLVAQVDSSSFRCTYDFSHLWLAGYDLAESLDALLPVCPYIHVKDAVRTSDGHRFLLPGDGETDYVAMFQKLRETGYSGFVNVEVSAQIHRSDDFHPIEAAMTCYDRMEAAFETADLQRP